MLLFLANFLWFLCCLPDYFLFRVALWFPRAAQRAAARRRTKDFPVLFHQPTSGSTGGAKDIPYTCAFLREFRRGLNPWIAGFYIRHPSLLFATHYWSVSPAVRPVKTGGGGSGGGVDDSEYLGFGQRWLARRVFAVPASIATESDPARHAFRTLLYLLGDHRLGLISVWHPSFLLVLLRTAKEERVRLVEALTSPLRAAYVNDALAQGEAGYQKLWPRLRVISCWDQGRAKQDAETLRRLFPNVEVQGKGLLATEGVVTIPWHGDAKVAAIRSHGLRFVACETEEILPSWSVKPGDCYEVQLDAANGQRNYALGDVVRCTGFVGRTPCFDFIARTGVVDLVGEKLSAAHVETALSRIETIFGPALFAMLAPNEEANGYLLHIESATDQPTLLDRFAEMLEAELTSNPYYRHAREAGQLRPLRVNRVTCGAIRWRKLRQAAGQLGGAIKIPALWPHAISFDESSPITSPASERRDM
ncbi:MAG: GH3 auxin-responsive promoter family protein [Phycisphaerales bacterium]|nr:GH3 auxin-responsive promoter family protein [Phycisphaerales bacterium]